MSHDDDLGRLHDADTGLYGYFLGDDWIVDPDQTPDQSA